MNVLVAHIGELVHHFTAHRSIRPFLELINYVDPETCLPTGRQVQSDGMN